MAKDAKGHGSDAKGGSSALQSAISPAITKRRGMRFLTKVAWRKSAKRR